MSTPTHTAPAFNRKNPCMARLKHAVTLSKDGSPKDTRHFEFDLCGSGMTFEPGDSLAVLPTNCPDLVGDVVAALGHSGDESVTDLDGKPVTLREALTSSCAITIPDKKLLAALAERAPGPDADALKALLDPGRKDDLNAHLYGREVIDFLLQFPAAKFTPQEFVSQRQASGERVQFCPGPCGEGPWRDFPFRPTRPLRPRPGFRAGDFSPRGNIERRAQKMRPPATHDC